MLLTLTVLLIVAVRLARPPSPPHGRPPRRWAPYVGQHYQGPQ